MNNTTNFNIESEYLDIFPISKKYNSNTVTVSTNSIDDFNIATSIIVNAKQQIEWQKINDAATTNKALQQAIDRVKILYYLSTEDGNSKT